MMLSAEARVATDRPGRYLAQLCQHIDAIAAARSPMRANVQWSDDHGLIDFGWGRCSLYAESGALLLRAEAADEGSLRQLQDRLTGRLEQIGRRDGLRVAWSTLGNADPTLGPPPGAAHHMEGHHDD